MVNWLSYMPDIYYDDTVYQHFKIDRDTMIHEILNSKDFFYNSINTIRNNINSLHELYIYDCCCNVGSWNIMLSQYAKMCYGVDTVIKYIQIAKYVASKHNISNCQFFNVPFFDINNKEWYFKSIPHIDILLCLSFGFRLFRNTDKIMPLFNMIKLIQHYRPRYIIIENMYYYNYIFSELLHKFVKCLSIYNYKKRQENGANPLWIFICE